MSQVIVIDSAFRRHVIKTTPEKRLNDILNEACTKFGVNPDIYVLKYNKKTLDLSRTWRLSGITPGAKVELVQGSRSTSAISVALNLPPSEVGVPPTNRLIDKFPSTSTLWMILRAFESGAKGESKSRNFTGRGVPTLGGGLSGAGRMYYESPVLHITGKDYQAFADFQKSLSQLGIKDGSISIRLTFVKTEKPLEEAMAEMNEYFKAAEDENQEASDMTAGGPLVEAALSSLQQDRSSNAPPENEAKALENPNASVPRDDQIASLPISSSATLSGASSAPDTSSRSIASPHGRSIAVFAPPTSKTPQAAQLPYVDADYEPTIHHAKLHQARLKDSSQNKRLANHADEAGEQVEKAHQLATVPEVKVQIRFPDQARVETNFTQEHSGQSLYDCVRSVMSNPAHSFVLKYLGPKGSTTIPNDPTVKLITGLKMTGRVLVTFLWAESVGPEHRHAGLLKQDVRAQAQKLEVRAFAGTDAAAADARAAPKPEKEGIGKKLAGGLKSGVPKWLKLPGKK